MAPAPVDQSMEALRSTDTGTLARGLCAHSMNGRSDLPSSRLERHEDQLGMCKAFPLLMTVLLVAFAGCSYQDFRRPPLRNYAADLRYKPLRPAEGAAPEIERVDLAEALARWRQMEGPVEETYAVGPGDVLRVSLFVQGQVGGNVVMEVPVTETGRISCPLVGEVQVAGLDTARIHTMTPDEIRAHVLDLFEKAGAGGGLIASTHDLDISITDCQVDALVGAIKECTY